MDSDTPFPSDPDDRQQFIDEYIRQKRAEAARLKAMTPAEIRADLEARAEQGWRLDAEVKWELRQAQQLVNRLPPRAARPSFPPGATVPPDVGSRLEALEDSVGLLHTKLDTLIAQLAAWERGQADPPQA